MFDNEQINTDAAENTVNNSPETAGSTPNATDSSSQSQPTQPVQSVSTTINQTQEPTSIVPPVKKHNKLIPVFAAVAAVLIISILFLVLVPLFGNNEKEPIKFVEKFSNATEVEAIDFAKDFLNGVDGGYIIKAFKILGKSDLMQDKFAEEVSDEIAGLHENLIKAFGSDVKVKYTVEGKEELKNSKLKEYRDSVHKIGDNFYEIGKYMTGAGTSKVSEKLNLSRDDVKKAGEYLKSAGEKLKNADVTKGYKLEVLMTVTGKKLDEPREEYPSLPSFTVVKVNGRWVSCDVCNGGGVFENVLFYIALLDRYF